MRNAMLVVLLALPVGWLAFGQTEKAQPSASGALSSGQIGRLLKDIGCDPQPLSPEVWQVSLERDGWKVHVMVSLSPDADRIWLECKFAPIPDTELVASSAWLRLLEENERIGPAHFAFDKSDKRLHLYKAFDNIEVTPARLKKELDAFDAVVRRTQSIWKFENFAPGESLPAPRAVEVESKERAMFDGAWRIVRIEEKGESITEERLRDLKPSVTFSGEKAIIKTGRAAERTVRVKFDPKQGPPAIDFIDDKNQAEAGIYNLEAGLLTICVAGAGESRPRQFITDAKGRSWLLVMKREE